jgi:uncharacterized protein affecting Mg2+/Co2+ transport
MITEFNNARLDYQNFTFGPDAGRIYSIDHITGTLIVKNDPAGNLDTPVSLITTIPLNTAITSEVKTLQYDGFYFWTQRDIGGSSPIGTLIEKWAFNYTGTVLNKQFGPGSEISIVDTASEKFRSEAMAIHTLSRTFSLPFGAGVSTITLDDTSLIEIGDSLYLGPNGADEREEVTVLSVLGNDVNLVSPTQYAYTSGQTVTVRKSMWMFNNRNGLEPFKGQLRQYSTYNGGLISSSTGNEWKDVTASTCYNGDLYYIRDTQFLVFRPLGLDAGYQNSGIVNNTESNNNTLIKVYDISINNAALSKLQLSLTEFNTFTKEFDDILSTDGKYQIEREFFAPKVKSITAIRNARSIAFGESIEIPLTIEIRDQFNIPVFGRSVTVTDDNATGYIKVGEESFVTDSQGQGQTTYVTGAGLEAANPLITAVDVITDLRGNFITQQVDKEESITQTEQVKTESTSTSIDQQVAESVFYVDQSLVLESSFLMEQLIPSTTTTQLQQLKPTVNTPLVQVLRASGIVPIIQEPSLQTTTTLNQYIFLIFAIPEPYSKKNDPTTNILVRLVGFGSLNLNPSTLSFKVNGIEVASQVSITAFAGGLELEYDPSLDFPYGSRVTVEISIQDDGVPPNTVTTAYYFDIIEDFRKPVITQLFPPDESINNDPETEIFAIIEDTETGIDETSIEMYVEGRLVEHTLTELSESSVKVSFTPTCKFPYESSITASVKVDDNSGNRLIETWTFYVQQSPGVLFIDKVPSNCQVLVPIDTDLCSEVFGLEEGVHIGSLTFDINGKPVKYMLKPKVYRKE